MNITTTHTVAGEPRYQVRYYVPARHGSRTKSFRHRRAAEDFAASLEPDVTPPFIAAPEVAVDGENWRTRAVCRPQDPDRVGELAEFFGVTDLFFAELPAGQGQAIALATRAAVGLCGECPVRPQCLDLALRAEFDHHPRPRYGIFGGTTPRQRDRIAAARRRKAS